MGLDYSRGCINFRDVGECVNLIADRNILPLRRILRGGKLEFVEAAEKIGCPGTIINLRKGPDPIEKRFGADYWQFAVSNKQENYSTSNPIMRKWLNEIMSCLSLEVKRFPLLFHCTSGKDRTGIVVAALLTILEVDRELIIQEYLWSEGKIARAYIEEVLDGIGKPSGYFPRISLPALREKIYCA